MLYQLNTGNPAASYKEKLQCPAAVGLSEKHIEEFFASHLHDLIPENQLLLIGQERQWQEEADLFALDRHGTLYIFELKRWQSCPENLLQVMRYGQKFGRYSYEELQDLAHRHQKLQGDLKARHQQYFGLDEPLHESKFNSNQVFVVVTNGVDRDTLEAIRYWSNKGVQIHSLTYKTYLVADKPYIYFDVYNPEQEVLLEENTGIYVVNTNASYMPDIWQDMVANSKAAAYYDRKYAISGIPNGSVVYLYHTGIGIIAKGKAKGGCRKVDFNGDKEEEFNIPLNFDWVLKEKSSWNKAVSAGEINKKLNRGYRFRQTAFSISQELAQAIDDIWKEHQSCH